ncbi:hypothetical protein RHSIM_Rhsim08G0184500 [Rhododendron simsii]|uniref:Kinesin motor domain-containing protein n=1 Tax=Rhododendron simsii TaxID=118357 RepID=A0A834LGL5_RHOSS|nr:hypothetical protein RHSIM_Rhsim08G0184500 [Rhododendron simsii]
MERIHVTVRTRPLSPEDDKTSPWRISGNSISNPNHSSKFEFGTLSLSIYLSICLYIRKYTCLYRIFGESCKTQEVYEARTKNIVAAAVCGFNELFNSLSLNIYLLLGTVFAYGQTNSGKTHTMRGSTAEPGVIPCAVHDLFGLIQEDTDREFLLRMSYMEIYNEEINDLLAPEHRKLQIHESLERGIFVAGLREEIVASPEQVLEFMEFGESHRHIGETNMNLYSSRSHTIFRMIIESRNRCEDEDVGSSCDAVRVSVLNLVDLAGSERAAKTGAEGVRLKEGSHINKSLMTLGTVIKKLSEGAESQGGHVPYRDSKLTRILQPALGGNANTAIICNITLAQIHADETKSSLQFASRALRVTNCARVNEILTDAALLKRQKKEIEELKAKLQGSHSEHFEEEILCLRNTLLQTELERERIALELEEEKKAQAEREKRLQEQAKKIENLSSMVLYSNRDENRDNSKKHVDLELARLLHHPGSTKSTEGSAHVPPHHLVCSIRSSSEPDHCKSGKFSPHHDWFTLDLRLGCRGSKFIHFNKPGLRISVGPRRRGEFFSLSPLLGSVLVSVGEGAGSVMWNLSQEKRRDTWCFGNLSRETLRELNSIVHVKASAVKPTRSEHMGPLLPFEELVNEASMDISCKPEEECNDGEVKYCTLPDPHALLHVTSRKKAPVKKKSLPVESNDLEELQAEYEDLLLKFETQRTVSEIQIDFLTRKLVDADSYPDEKPSRSAVLGDGAKCLRESEAILVIKQLQEKINMLEMEKSSSQQKLDCVVELATEQTICARDKYEELYEELLNAKEAARIAREELTSKESITTTDMDGFDTMIKLLKEVQEITSEVQTTKNLAESMSLVTDELSQSFSVVLNLFFVSTLESSLSGCMTVFFVNLFLAMQEFKSLACQNSVQLRSIVSDHGKLHDCMRNTVNELENEKLLLLNKSVHLQSQIQELSLNVQNSARASTNLSEEHDLEKAELFSQIQSLEKEISYLSSSSLAREKENLRKDLEKTKTKLKETESKLKNAIQEKTKLEGEKACAERELKKLHGQKALLERDINKRESLAGRRRDSVVDRTSNVFDPKRAKGLPASFDQTLQEDYKKLEVLAFEMETTIASLEEELAAAREEKDVTVSRTESLTSDLQTLYDKLSLSNLELSTLQGEISDLRLCLEESKSHNHELEGFIKTLVEEKEELALQLTEALLSMEEEKAIWSAKEKASIEAIEDKSKSYNAEITLLSKEMSEPIQGQPSSVQASSITDEVDPELAYSRQHFSTSDEVDPTSGDSAGPPATLFVEVFGLGQPFFRVRNELVSCRKERKVLEEKLVGSEENAKLEKKFSLEKSLENDRLREELRSAEDLNKKSQELVLLQDIKLQLQKLTLDHHHACEEVHKVRTELSVLNKEKEYLVNQVKELDKGSVLMDDCQVSSVFSVVNYIQDFQKRRISVENTSLYCYTLSHSHLQVLRNQLLVLMKERDKGMARIEEQCQDVKVESCARSSDERSLKAKAEVEALTCQLSRLEAKLHHEQVINNKENTKLRMRLRGTQAKLEAFTVRYKEAVEESDLMNRKFEEAAAKLKAQLASYALEVLNLKKQLVAVNSR